MPSSSSNLPVQTVKAKGIIAWFANNPVAANLLMVLILVSGIASYFTIEKKLFPEFNPNIISVTVDHLGASPEEVESSVILRIEEALEDLEGIKEITATAREGRGEVNLELSYGVPISEKLDEVQALVDAITTFPEEIETPVVLKTEFKDEVLWLSVRGDLDRKARQELAQTVRDEILLLPGVNSARVVGKRDYEISIEVSDEKLREYDLTFDDIAQAIRQSSVDLPGGKIKTQGGDILLRTQGQVYTGEHYGNLLLRTDENGIRLYLADVANIIDGFVEGDGFAYFNGQQTTSVVVESTANQNDLAIAKEVKEYVAAKQAQLPKGVSISIWGDSSYYLSERLDMMLSNLAIGAVLVFIVLTLFLRLRVAFWVMLGIPISFMGAVMLMPLAGEWAVSINLLSLFAFIMVLGIVVDDAIVIGESIYSEIEEKGHSTENVIQGTLNVAMPATFGVLTTIAAFTPLLAIDSSLSGFFQSIALVVSYCLIFSLIESKWILPAHLAHMKYVPITEENANWLERIQLVFKKGLAKFIQKKYLPLLNKALTARYTTMAAFFAVLIISFGLIASSQVKTEVFPVVPSDFIEAYVALTDGSSIEQRNKVIDDINAAALAMVEKEKQETGENILKNLMIFTEGDTGAAFVLELVKKEQRSVSSYDIEKHWREQIGELAGVRDLRIFASVNTGGGAALSFQLSGQHDQQLEEASTEIMDALREYDGVYDIRTSFSRGTQEIKLAIKPEAEALGLTLAELGKQVRQAFFGEEAQRIQRGRDELKVMIRYPEEDRLSLSDLENMWIKLPSNNADGELHEVPFYQVADIAIGQGFSTIERINQKRTITISADIDSAKVESRKVLAEMDDETIPAILSNYPLVEFGLEGASNEQEKLIRQLKFALIGALFLIYGLIAIPTKSYIQPLVIMSVIPFGIIGAIWGHYIFAKTINMMSMYGFIALTGVVVNDSLIMVDFINRAKAQGIRIKDAVMQAGQQRFRAILLTSLTTFFGVFPLYFETSLQAQFIIPMAISLGFGILFATVITLFLIPSLYLIKEDILSLIRGLYKK